MLNLFSEANKIMENMFSHISGYIEEYTNFKYRRVAFYIWIVSSAFCIIDCYNECVNNNWSAWFTFMLVFAGVANMIFLPLIDNESKRESEQPTTSTMNIIGYRNTFSVIFVFVVIEGLVGFVPVDYLYIIQGIGTVFSTYLITVIKPNRPKRKESRTLAYNTF